MVAIGKFERTTVALADASSQEKSTEDVSSEIKVTLPDPDSHLTPEGK